MSPNPTKRARMGLKVNMLIFYFQLLSLISLFNTVNSISCLNDQGEDVDFFMALKLPNCFEYYFLSSPAPFSLTKSTQLLNESSMNTSIEMTLGQLYGELPTDYGYAMYNDETEDTSTSYYAHAKGVVYFDGKQGFWLIHSMPKYPSPISEGYNGFYDKTYGQSFICITLETSSFELVAQQLEISRPMIYDSNISSSLTSTLPTFTSWISGTHSSTEEKTVTLQTINGYEFTHIVKSSCDDDFYEEYVATTLDSDLRVETWRHGTATNNMPSFCPPNYTYVVENIEYLQIQSDTWKNTQDHSKWAVSSDDGKNFVCIGDLNRQYSQDERGGGTICYEDETIKNIFYSIITEYESCVVDSVYAENKF